jgi:acyl carrier protein
MLEKIKSLLAQQVDINPDDVKPEASFQDDLGIDSLDLFEMVMSLEDEYGVEIPPEDLEKIVTVADIIEYLSAKGIQ